MTADELAAHQWDNLSEALGWKGSQSQLTAGLEDLAARNGGGAWRQKAQDAGSTENDDSAPYP
jgi:hypothetical protein